MSASQFKREVSQYSLLLHEAGFVANHDGNVSLRAGRGFFISPTGISKRLCAPETIVECDPAGKPVSKGRPPSEVAMHLGAYEAREDVNAVIHAHPPYASAFALAQRPIDPVGMPEVAVSIGARIPMVPLFVPKDPAVKEAVQDALQIADVALLAGNGALAVGPDLETAYLRLELLEHYAKVLCICRGGVGEPVALDAASSDAALALRKKAGLHRGGPQGGPPGGRPTEGAPASDVRALVAEEVRRALGAGRNT